MALEKKKKEKSIGNVGPGVVMHRRIRGKHARSAARKKNKQKKTKADTPPNAENKKKQRDGYRYQYKHSPNHQPCPEIMIKKTDSSDA